MTNYFKYLSYVVRHKWYVFRECARHGLFWQGVVHDMSKFLPSEFIPYARHFYGDKKSDVGESTTGYQKPEHTGDLDFDWAWELHKRRNPHHWENWHDTVISTTGAHIPYSIAMPTPIAMEMVCDWKGAGKATGHPDTKAWYLAHKDGMVLHPVTRHFVEKLLGFTDAPA